jgi:tripartite-type tricarboxylate transporter receptor subunit TctC
MTMHRRSVTTLALAAFAMGLCGPAAAQADRTVRILVGFPPGGSLDTVARLLAEKMGSDLKVNFVIDNKPGAGGRVAADMLKNAAPDGTTLMATPVVVPVLAPLVFAKLNYNPATDFAPVGHMANFDFAFTVPMALPVKNINEWLAWAKANPAKANFGSPSAGSLPHFFGEMLSREAKADLVHVPFAGGAPLMNALLGNQVSAGIDVVLEAAESHRNAKVRVLATSGEKRSTALPDVPTFKESGHPQIAASGWFALYAPAKTPDAMINAYNRALNKALAQPDVIERFAKLALEPGGGSAADLVRLQEASTARWAPVVKATGFRAD